jgi:hypothetical protein
MTILDDVKADIATLTREVAKPVPPLNYGVDLRCTTDLHDDLAETDPNSPEGIGEAIVRRWTCSRGQNGDDPDYGRDARSLLNRGLTRAELLAEAGLLRAEAEKEETVDTCEVSLVVDSLGKSVQISSTVTPVDPSLEPFRMAVALTDGATMLEIQR